MKLPTLLLYSVNLSPGEEKIKNASAYVTAAGFYELYLNGSKVGDHVLDPGITDYRKLFYTQLTMLLRS